MRRLWALMQGLPPGCALHRATDPEGYAWDMEQEMLASLVEQTDVANIMFMKAHSAKKSVRTPKPVQIPRPYQRQKTKPRRMSTPAEIRAFFEGAVRVSPKGDKR